MVFVGRQLGFNPATKCFWLDRSVPKKKLSPVEMVEIKPSGQLTAASGVLKAMGRGSRRAPSPPRSGRGPGSGVGLYYIRAPNLSADY
jgi:hypothetical protein